MTLLPLPITSCLSTFRRWQLQGKKTSTPVLYILYDDPQNLYLLNKLHGCKFQLQFSILIFRNARNGSSYSYVQSVPCETGAAQGSRNPGNLGRYKPFTPLQRKRTTVHIYLPKLDDDKDEEGVDQSECSNDIDDQSSEDDDLDIVSVANENEAASDDESITRSSSLALSPRAPSTLNSMSLSSMRQYRD